MHDYKYEVKVTISSTTGDDHQIINNIENDVSTLLRTIEENNGNVVNITQTHLTPEQLQTTVVYQTNN